MAWWSITQQTEAKGSQSTPYNAMRKSFDKKNLAIRMWQHRRVYLFSIVAILTLLTLQSTEAFSIAGSISTNAIHKKATNGLKLQFRPRDRQAVVLRTSFVHASLQNSSWGDEGLLSTLEVGPPTSVELEKNVTFSATTEVADVATTEESDKIQVPGVRKVLKFAIPAIGVWLCSPLLSMIDTSTVGLFSGTLQQAALNPATAVTDYSARLMSFLYTGATNMIAVAKEEDRGVEGKPKTAKSFLGALQLSLFVGAGLGSMLLLFARPFLRGLIGNDAIDPEVFGAAMRYVRIRALGMPAAAMIGTAQAACLGMQDVQSPLYIILVAALVNLVFDLLLVGQPQAWIGGAAGAAWATIASQYFAISLFLKWLSSKPKEEHEYATLPQSSGRIASIISLPRRKFRAKTKKLTTRGLLANRLSFKSFFQRPDKEISGSFKPYVLPVTTTQVGRCSTYIAMGHVVSSAFDTVSMAANQIITSIFYSLIPIADSLSLTAQSFLPSMVARKPGPEKSKAIRGLTSSILKVAGLCGLMLAGVVACIPATSHLFTTDVAVLDLVRRIVPVLFAIFSLHGVFCGSEGILLGQKDLTFLGRTYAVYFAVVPFLMLQVKKAARLGSPVDLSTVWNLFLGYQLFRISNFVGRVVFLQRKTDKEAVAANA